MTASVMLESDKCATWALVSIDMATVWWYTVTEYCRVRHTQISQRGPWAVADITMRLPSGVGGGKTCPSSFLLASRYSPQLQAIYPALLL